MVHRIRAVYNCTEYEVLWRDWHWVEDNLKRIVRDQNEQKRWDLQAYLLSASFAFHGKEGGAADGWDSLFNSTFTKEEKRLMQQAEEEAMEQELQRQRQERMAYHLALEEEAKRAAQEAGDEEVSDKRIFFGGR